MPCNHFESNESWQGYHQTKSHEPQPITPIGFSFDICRFRSHQTVQLFVFCVDRITTIVQVISQEWSGFIGVIVGSISIDEEWFCKCRRFNEGRECCKECSKERNWDEEYESNFVDHADDGGDEQGDIPDHDEFPGNDSFCVVRVFANCWSEDIVESDDDIECDEREEQRETQDHGRMRIHQLYSQNRSVRGT